MNDLMELNDSETVLTDEARRSKLARHLAQLVRRGGTVEEQHAARAVVVVSERPKYLPAIALAVAGVAFYLTVGGVIFLLAAGAALLGWHRKLVAGVDQVRLLVRIDELGRVSEMELGRTQAA
ncbi:MAG: hypothetical protein JWN72_1748 [Thermoleophilia bacterium]|nr:hypothetical protein [Thermoleophilia bacterium]